MRIISAVLVFVLLVLSVSYASGAIYKPAFSSIIMFVAPNISVEVQTALQTAYAQAYAAGLTGDMVSINWSDFEPTPGQYNTAILPLYFQFFSALNITPYFTIKTIDTNNLAIPSDLLDPSDSTNFRRGLGWNSSIVLQRYCKMVSVIFPGFNQFFSGSPQYRVRSLVLGNEVDVWLNQHPDQLNNYVSFIRSASSFIRNNVSSNLQNIPVSLTITAGSIISPYSRNLSLALLSSPRLCDFASFTYYPINDDFSVQSFDRVLNDIGTLLKLTPANLPVIFAEIGFQSGWLPNVTYPYDTSNYDNTTEAKQSEFIGRFIREILYVDKMQGNASRIEGFNIMMMNDWGVAVCNQLMQYYGLVGNMPFREYLCTLGLLDAEGNPKLAWNTYLESMMYYYGNNTLASASQTPQVTKTQIPSSSPASNVLTSSFYSKLRNFING